MHASCALNILPSTEKRKRSSKTQSVMSNDGGPRVNHRLFVVRLCSTQSSVHATSPSAPSNAWTSDDFVERDHACQKLFQVVLVSELLRDDVEGVHVVYGVAAPQLIGCCTVTCMRPSEAGRQFLNRSHLLENFAVLKCCTISKGRIRALLSSGVDAGTSFRRCQLWDPWKRKNSKAFAFLDRAKVAVSCGFVPRPSDLWPLAAARITGCVASNGLVIMFQTNYR